MRSKSSLGESGAIKFCLAETVSHKLGPRSRLAVRGEGRELAGERGWNTAAIQTAQQRGTATSTGRGERQQHCSSLDEEKGPVKLYFWNYMFI